MASKQAKAAKEAETQSILDYFAELPDPRRDNENKRHQLLDILAISILATICGAEHFTAELAERKKEDQSKAPRAAQAADFVETIDHGHGRRETRRVYSLSAPEFLSRKEQWRDLKSLIMVEAIREVNDQMSAERRYYIASLAPKTFDHLTL